MTPRRLGASAVVLALLAALSIALLDVRIACGVAELPEEVPRFFRTGTDWFDRLSGKGLANSVLPLALIVVALAAWWRPALRPLAKVLVLVALCNYLSHSVTGALTPICGRLRPYEIEEAGWIDRFFAGGKSFPSGHTAYYFGLCLPLAWAWPRWRVLLLLPACFIAAARVLVNDHFAGDVLGSLAITVGVCATLIALLQRYARLERLGWPGDRSRAA
jgi:membrane-associated phospholipid phosphatase